MVKLVHAAWKESVMDEARSGGAKALPAAQLSAERQKQSIIDRINGLIPRMPVQDEAYEHSPHDWMARYALVARPVNKQEIAENQEARDAMSTEFTRLQDKKTWLLEGVREWRAVAQDARRKGVKIHVGRVFGIALPGYCAYIICV